MRVWPDSPHGLPCPALRGMSEVDKLGTVERYFVEVKGIPRLAERIRCFIFSRTYAATRAKVGCRAGRVAAGRLAVKEGAGYCSRGRRTPRCPALLVSGCSALKWLPPWWQQSEISGYSVPPPPSAVRGPPGDCAHRVH